MGRNKSRLPAELTINQFNCKIYIDRRSNRNFVLGQMCLDFIIMIGMRFCRNRMSFKIMKFLCHIKTCFSKSWICERWHHTFCGKIKDQICRLIVVKEFWMVLIKFVYVNELSFMIQSKTRYEEGEDSSVWCWFGR